MQHAHPHDPIIHILQSQHLLHQPMTIHMPIPEPKLRPPLHLFHHHLALRPLHREADHGDSEFLTRRRLSVDSDPLVAVEILQKDPLKFLLVGCDLLPRACHVRSEVLQDAGDGLRQLVVRGGEVQSQIQCLGAFEVVPERVDLGVDAGGYVELGDVWAVDFVPGKCLRGV